MKKKAQKNQNSKRRVGIYARVSTDRQANTQDGSIETQVDRIRKYIEFENQSTTKEFELVFAGEYIDPGHSAKDLKRPEITRLQDDIESGRIDCVIVTKIDRITRSLSDFVQLDAFFSEHDTVLISIDDKLDTSTAMGKAMQQLLIVFAELERSLTAERTSKQMYDRAEKGLYNGGPRVWGYRLNPERRGIPQIDNEQKGQILQIFRQYSEPDVSLRDLQKWMQAMKIVRPEYVSRNKNKCGGKVPDLSTLQNILSNVFYIGKSKYGGELHDGKHEPLFDSEEEKQIWEEVQKKLTFRSPKKNPRPARGGWKKNAKHIFVLNSLLFCSSCGSAMSHDSGTGRDKSTRHYYTCVRRKKHGKESCSCPSLAADAIEEAILERLNILSINSNLLRQIISEADEGRSEEIQILEEDKRNLEERLRVSKREIKGIIEILKLDGADALPSIREELGALESGKARLIEDLERVTERIGELRQDIVPAEEISSKYQKLGQVLDKATTQDLKRLLPAVIRRIEWSPNSDGVRGGTYRMELFPTPLIPETLESGEGELNGDGSHCCSEWLPRLDSNQRQMD